MTLKTTPDIDKPSEESWNEIIRVPLSTASSSHIGPIDAVRAGLAAREQLGWGARYQPPVEDAPQFRRFRELCAELRKLVPEFERYSSDESTTDDATSDVAEMEQILDRLYECKWGDGESLKMIVVAILAQVKNARVDWPLVRFLVAVSRFLSAAYLIDQSAVAFVYTLIDEAGLDAYRGTLSHSGTVKRFKVIEVPDTHDGNNEEGT